jgi:translation initiation factor 2B subunit (eIF-2B alpha/beta/delta family)
LRACAESGLSSDAPASLAPAARALENLHAAARELADARPSMMALANTAGRIWDAAAHVPGKPPRSDSEAAARLALRAALEAATTALAEMADAATQITSHAAPLIQGTLLTHSLSGTVQTVLMACKAQLEHVYVTEARPRCEGRETARALVSAGIPTTLLTDAEAGIFLSQCQAVVVGADTVLADGAVVNKAGTYLLALAARAKRPRPIPLLVLTEQMKIAPYHDEHLEEMDPAEVAASADLPGIVLRNIYFDRTPAALVTKLITEAGPLSRSQIRAQAAQARRWARLLARD